MPPKRAVRKRAATSPEADVQPDPPKRSRQAKKAAVKDDAGEDSEDQQVTDVKTKGKANGSKAAASNKVKASGKKTSTKDKKTTAVKDEDDGSGDEDVSTKPKSTKKKASKPTAELKAEESSTQIAKVVDLVIPVDEGCGFGDGQTLRVYVDDNGIIYDGSLNQTNASNNNNKFYKLQVITNGRGKYGCWTRWGRVGEFGTGKMLAESSQLAPAMHEFESKFRSKSGLRWENRLDPPKAGKYSFIEKSYEPDSEDDANDEVKEEKKDEDDGDSEEPQEPPKSALAPEIQSLMAFIFNQEFLQGTMADLNYDANKMPLGKLSKSTILRGYQMLKDLAALINDTTLATSKYNTSYPQAVEQLSNQYYSYIPHAFGRQRPPIIGSDEALKKEVKLMESLTDLKDTDALFKLDKNKQVNAMDARYKGLGMREMTPVDKETDEFTHISNYLINTRGSSHSVKYEVIDIFRLEREGESDRFKVLPKDKSNRKLLWHGSRSTNYGGILSQGLRIAPPEAPVSGYMFGKGVYLADMSSKSANYCYHFISNGEALLLLCETELGNPIQELTNASYEAGETAKEKGLLSTWGQGYAGPLLWQDAGLIHPDLKGVQFPDTSKIPGFTGVANACLQYNEYICYDVSQIRLRYLLRVKM